MTNLPASNAFFVSAGTVLSPTDPSYIVRPADEQLYAQLSQGRPSFVLAPKQLGKSSLIASTAQRLRSNGKYAIVIDIAELASSEDKESWYCSVLRILHAGLGLDFNLEEWWLAQSDRSPVEKFNTYLSDVVASRDASTIVLLDNIDAIATTGFQTEFLATLHALYSKRAEEPHFSNLTFGMLGVMTAHALTEGIGRHAFNIDNNLVPLSPLTAEAAEPFRAQLLKESPENGAALFDRIFEWTAGHPSLTQQLCHYVVEYADDSWGQAELDAVIKTRFLSEARWNQPTLTFLRNYIEHSDNRSDLIDLFLHVERSQLYPDDESSLTLSQLKVIGIVAESAGRLQSGNLIFSRAFADVWDLDDVQKPPPKPASKNHKKRNRIIGIAVAVTVALIAFLVLSLLDSDEPEAIVQSAPIEATSAPTPLPTGEPTPVLDAATPVAESVTTDVPTAVALSPTSPPTAANTATSQPTEAPTERATITPAAEATVPPTSTVSPTEEATETVPPLPPPVRPSPTNHLCTDNPISQFRAGETIQFQWEWTGTLRAGEYLELRVGPAGRTKLTTLFQVVDTPNGTTEANAASFYETDIVRYEWQIVHMSQNGISPVAFSRRGCIDVIP